MNESFAKKGITSAHGGQRAQTSGQGVRPGQMTMNSSKTRLAADQDNNQIFNYSSDNNLHERRPGTSGNAMKPSSGLPNVMSEQSNADATAYSVDQVQDNNQL